MWPPSINSKGSYAPQFPVLALNNCNYVHLNCRYHPLAYADLALHQVATSGIWQETNMITEGKKRKKIKSSEDSYSGLKNLSI